MNQYAPIALFTYNRLAHTRATVQALLKNAEARDSVLYIFSDAAATIAQQVSVEAVRNYLKTVAGFREVHIRARITNYGLGKNIIEGVTEIINKHGKIIVLEDDLITAPNFLKFMNDGLHTYENNPKVASIHGYVYPVKQQLPETFFVRGADCLGWATWERAWDQFEEDGEELLKQLRQSQQINSFDFDNAYPYTKMLEAQVQGTVSSWAVRWYASAFLKNLFTLYPSQSLVFHAGGDGSGTNTGYDQQLDVTLRMTPVNVIEQDVQQDLVAYAAFRQALQRLGKPSLIARIRRKLKSIIK